MRQFIQPIDFLQTRIYANTRLRTSKSQVYLEEKKPFFLVRFCRWITGQYNERKTINAIYRIASAFLVDNHSAKECNTLLANYNVLLLKQKPSRKHPLEVHTNLIERIRQQAEAAGIVLKDTTSSLTAQEFIELANRWNQAVDGDDDWKTVSLVACDELEFSEKLSTPEGILQWVIDPTHQKIDSGLKVHVPHEGNSTKLIIKLLTHLGIETPGDCIDLGLEPTNESLSQYLLDNRTHFIQTFRDLGFIS